MLKRAYIEITNICNLSCSFCPGTTRKPDYMSTRDFKTIAAKLRPHTGYIYLHVMGEPLLHPDLDEILGIASELDLKVNITTNGTLIGSAAPILLKHSCIRKVSISLHSFEGNSDTMNGLNAYLEDVWSFCSAASSIVALRLWNGGGQDSFNTSIMDFLSRRTGLDVPALPFDANGRRLGPKLYLESADKFTWPIEEQNEKPVTFCHGLTQQVAVLVDGSVVPCCLDSNGNMTLGNLLHEDFNDILNSPRAKALVQGFIDHAPSESLCRRCGYATRF